MIVSEYDSRLFPNRGRKACMDCSVEIIAQQTVPVMRHGTNNSNNPKNNVTGIF